MPVGDEGEPHPPSSGAQPPPLIRLQLEKCGADGMGNFSCPAFSMSVVRWLLWLPSCLGLLLGFPRRL